MVHQKTEGNAVTTSEILKAIGKIADENEIEIYAVGGYVRDLILERAGKDIDFVVVGDGVAFARKIQKTMRAKNLMIFERFGTAMLSLFDHQLEFVSARGESYSENSRKPWVVMSDLQTDLSRRDFTINALAMRISPEKYGEIIDPFDGQADIQKGILRTPLDPEETFSDDPLRIMRIIRFATQLNFSIEEKTHRAISKVKERLEIISQERITDELMKILAAPKPSIGFKLMDATSVLGLVLPELERMKGVEQRDDYHHKDVFHHTVQVIDNVAEVTDDSRLRFTAMVHDIAKPATKAFKEGIGWTFHGHDEIGARMLPRFCQRLKLPTDLMKYAQKLIRLHLRPIALASGEVTDSAIRRLIVQAGDDIDALFMLCRADITSGNPQRVQKHLANFDAVVQRMYEVQQKDKLRAFQSPVRGDKIMEICQLEPGPLVGKLKKMIEDAILDGVIPNEYDAALGYLLAHKDEVLKEK